jgi:uncharacterized protein (DUF1499 family)
MRSAVRRGLRILAALVIGIAIVFAAGRAMGLFSGKRPDSLGVTNGRLAPCKPSPNCVSSQAERGDTVHYVAPFAAGASPGDTFARLKRIVQETARARIVTDTPDYLYAEYSSRVFGFVDDVEFWLDARAGVIQVRSASRLGYSDLGVNRDRIEGFRARLAPAGRWGADRVFG